MVDVLLRSSWKFCQENTIAWRTANDIWLTGICTGNGYSGLVLWYQAVFLLSLSGTSGLRSLCSTEYSSPNHFFAVDAARSIEYST